MDEVTAERIIPANDSVRLLDQTVDEMDLRSLQSSYKRLGRKPAVQPITLLKVLLYAAMEGICSSRNIASACVRDINFIWLLNGEKTPNHYQIARFRSQLKFMSRTQALAIFGLEQSPSMAAYSSTFSKVMGCAAGVRTRRV